MAKKYRGTLTRDERADLRRLISRGKAAARKLAHARVLLQADEAEGGQDTLQRRIEQRERRRNAATAEVDWRFTTADVRIKLSSRHPSVQP